MQTGDYKQIIACINFISFEHSFTLQLNGTCYKKTIQLNSCYKNKLRYKYSYRTSLNLHNYDYYHLKNKHFFH